MRGASLRAVGELLGHQTVQMTMRYAHLSPGYLTSEIQLLDGPPKGKAKGQEKGKAHARGAATHRKLTGLLGKVARPAGLEPATSWFVAIRKEATGGSGGPLPQCLRAFSNT
mgnify:CR=1 FL=1